MLLLLDENIPKKLKNDFPGHQVFTVKQRGWYGLKNGLLLQKLTENDFHALITFEKIFSTSKILQNIQSQFLFLVHI